MVLHVPLDDARVAFREGLEALTAAAGDLDDLALLAPSRCLGWSRLEVVAHLVAGGQEMLGGFVSPTEEAPTVDAASYWSAFAETFGDEDPVAVLMSQRRRAVSYARPTSAVAHLRDVAASLDRAVALLGPGRLRWQGWVFEAGDFLAIWAVENAVHHLDLLVDGEVPKTALHLVRATVETVLDEPLPPAWSDAEVALVGTGRAAPPSDVAGLANRLPVLG